MTCFQLKLSVIYFLDFTEFIFFKNLPKYQVGSNFIFNRSDWEMWRVDIGHQFIAIFLCSCRYGCWISIAPATYLFQITIELYDSNTPFITINLWIDCFIFRNTI